MVYSSARLFEELISTVNNYDESPAGTVGHDAHSRRSTRGDERDELKEPRRRTRTVGERRLVPPLLVPLGDRLAALSTRSEHRVHSWTPCSNTALSAGGLTPGRWACRRGTARPRLEGFLTTASALTTVASPREQIGGVLPPPPHLLTFFFILHAFSTPRENAVRLSSVRLFFVYA